MRLRNINRWTTNHTRCPAPPQWHTRIVGTWRRSWRSTTRNKKNDSKVSKVCLCVCFKGKVHVLLYKWWQKSYQERSEERVLRAQGFYGIVIIWCVHVQKTVAQCKNGETSLKWFFKSCIIQSKVYSNQKDVHQNVRKPCDSVCTLKCAWWWVMG